MKAFPKGGLLNYSGMGSRFKISMGVRNNLICAVLNLVCAVLNLPGPAAALQDQGRIKGFPQGGGALN